MIRCVMIDDEKDSHAVMKMLLKTYCPQVVIEAECTDAEKGIQAIRQFNPDLVFLDIEMPGKNGFDMLEAFGEPNFEVVFVTAYHQFAIKAFRYSALNYLLKPVDPDDLMTTIKRVEKKITVPLKEQLDLLMQHLHKSEKQTLSRIALTTADGLLFVPTADIIYCESDGNYTKVVLKEGRKILVSKTLKEIDETLSGQDFFRIHNSWLVNLNHIQKYLRAEGGHVEMTDGSVIYISRTKKNEFMELFSKF